MHTAQGGHEASVQQENFKDRCALRHSRPEQLPRSVGRRGGGRCRCEGQPQPWTRCAKKQCRACVQTYTYRAVRKIYDISKRIFFGSRCWAPSLRLGNAKSRQNHVVLSLHSNMHGDGNKHEKLTMKINRKTHQNSSVHNLRIIKDLVDWHSTAPQKHPCRPSFIVQPRWNHHLLNV